MSHRAALSYSVCYGVSALVLSVLIAAACAPAAPQPVKPAAAPPAAAPPAAAAPAKPAQAPKPAAPVEQAKPAQPAKPVEATKPAQITKVKLGVSANLIYLPLFAAKELGHFEREGLDAELIQFEGGSAGTAAMLGGSIDIQVTTPDRPLLLAENGQQTKNLVSVLNRVQQAIVVRPDLEMTYGDLKALKGKKIGMTTAGSGTDIYLRYALKTAGLTPDRDVTIIAVGQGPSQVAAFQARQIDGMNTNEPTISQTVSQMKIAKLGLDIAKDGPGLLKYMPFLSLSATSKWIDANPDTAKKVIRAQVRANEEMRTDVAKGVAITKKYFPNVDSALVELIVKSQAPYTKSEITSEEMQTAVLLNKELGLLSKDVAYEEVVVAKEFRDLWK